VGQGVEPRRPGATDGRSGGGTILGLLGLPRAAGSEGRHWRGGRGAAGAGYGVRSRGPAAAGARRDEAIDRLKALDTWAAASRGAPESRLEHAHGRSFNNEARCCSKPGRRPRRAPRSSRPCARSAPGLGEVQLASILEKEDGPEADDLLLGAWPTFRRGLVQEIAVAALGQATCAERAG